MEKWLEIIALIAALIGAAAWLQQPVFDYFRKAEYMGKLLVTMDPNLMMETCSFC